MSYDDVPWADSTKWKQGHWYPVLMTYCERDQDEVIPNGYGIFMLDPAIDESDQMFGDIVPVGMQNFALSQVIDICEEHNGELLLPKD